MTLQQDDLLQPADEALAPRTLRGAKWSYLATFINAGLQVFVTAVLARAIAPTAFGLVAMAALVLRLGQYFAQMGIGQAIVQRRELTREQVSAGLWASVAMGCSFSILVYLAAPFAEVAFRVAGLTPVIRAMGLTFFIGGTGTVANAILRRELRFRAIALSDISAYAVGYAGVGILMAVAGRGVWSIVAAALCQSLFSSLAYNFIARPHLTRVRSWRAFRDILGFGSKVSLISFLEFLNSSLDTLIVGRVSGATALGYYSRALGLAAMPMQYMSTSLSSVLLPSFSRIQHDRDRLGRAYLSVMTIFAGVGLPIAFGMSGAAREIVAVLLGAQWAASVPVMRLVTVASAASMLAHFGGVTLEATAQLRDKLVMRSAQLALFAVLLFGLSRFGLFGYALAFTVSEVMLHVVLAARVGSLFGIAIRDNVRAYTPGLASGLIVWAALYFESLAGAGLNFATWVVLLAQIATGALLLVAVGMRLDDGRVFYELSNRMGTRSGSGFPNSMLRIVAWISGNALGPMTPPGETPSEGGSRD